MRKEDNLFDMQCPLCMSTLECVNMKLMMLVCVPVCPPPLSTLRHYVTDHIVHTVAIVRERESTLDTDKETICKFYK